MNQRIEHLKDDEGNNLLSHYRIATNKYGQQRSVSVVDVRDGIGYRLMAMQMHRAGNRSKYLNYNQYHVSRKKTN
jgi:hypothetical protein